MHDRAVITHRSGIRNGQVELMNSSCGFIADRHDHQAYAAFLRQLQDNTCLPADEKGRSRRQKALTHFEAERVTRKLESLYLEELARKGYPREP